MQRDYKHYLQDIINYAQIVAETIAGTSYAEFATDRVQRAAVERFVEIIGEAAKHIPEDLRIKHPAEWRLAARMRDVLVHDYPGIVARIVWDTATTDVPLLLAAAAQALSNLKQLD